MLRGSTHAWKVNFCKFTNETRLGMEDASANSGLKFLAALNGICAGGGYELALACDEIVLVDDSNSAVSLPETPLLAVLPGTGGLTRVVDKRRVRRDLADVFGTLAEGVKGKRAVEWELVDAVYPASRFKEAVADARASWRRSPIGPADRASRSGRSRVRRSPDALEYSSVSVAFDRAKRSGDHHGARAGDGGRSPRPRRFWRPAISSGRSACSASWTTCCCGCGRTNRRSARSCSRPSGDPARVLEADAVLLQHRGHWFVREVDALHQAHAEASGPVCAHASSP